MIAELNQKESKYVSKSSIIQQTAYWSEVKRKQGIASRAFQLKVVNQEIFQHHKSTNPQYTETDLLVLLQRINQEQTIAYIPYGPKIEPSEEVQGQFLEELSESLRSYLPKKCVMLRYDLAWESHWAKQSDYYDNSGQWQGPPEKKYQEFRLNFSTQKWNLKKANSDILPSNTIFLDLKKNQASLLTAMKAKTRYNINLAIRKGIQIKEVGLEDLDIWYALYTETANRNHIYLNSISYFKTVLDAKVKGSTARTEVKLLIAESEGEPLAAMFLVISDKRATYLYGASSSKKRNYMATYALQWRAIQIAQNEGCIEYDLFGVAPRPEPSHPMYGLYKFKTGFGGTLHHRLGCWDYPVDQKQYELFKASEMNGQAYHL